jgi:hypothetical protein
MSEQVSRSVAPDTRPVYRLIRRTRLLLRSSWVVTGLGLSLGLLLGALVAVTAVDLIVPLPWPVLRLAALLLVVGPASWAFLVGVVRPLFRRLGPGQVARRIESHIPGIHNRLVSCIDLDLACGGRQPPDSRRSSGAFYRRLVTEALARIRGFRSRRVVDLLGLRRAALFAVASAAAFLLAWLIFSDRMPTAMARILNPFADIPPASDVLYTVAPGNASVLRGEDLTFAVNVEKGDPAELYLEMHGERGAKSLRHDLVKQKDGTWKFTLSTANIAAGFENAFRYRVHGGGTWSKQFEITIADRPTITNRYTVLHFPEYMALPEPRVGPPQTLEVTGPEGSQVEVVVEADGQVSEGAIQFLEARKRRLQPSEQVERVWFEDKLPDGAESAGSWQWQSAHGRVGHTEPPAIGTHAHWFFNTPLGFKVAEGECLFAYVYLVPEQKPDAIVLEWHDGTGWEHQAYWGDDKSKGKPNKWVRQRIGPLPPAGRWVRLEVPAARVGLEGKSLVGMAFRLDGGQCFWSRAGAVPLEVQDLTPVKSFPMKAKGENQWSGRFPLHGSGLYRVELRNEHGYANKTMKESKFLAIPDNPPQIVLERPGADLVLSTPGKVPLVIAAFDDFGLADVVLSMQRGDSGGFGDRVVKHYDKPVRSDSVLTTLDLAGMKLKVGDHIRYYVSAHDRKGQMTRTQEFIVRIAADPNAADKQLDTFDKSQDPFREQLAKLIAEQAKVQGSVEKLHAQYAPLLEKIEKEQAKIQPTPDGKPDPKQPPVPALPKLDPESAKALEALQKELAKLAPQEQQNVQLGKQIDDQLAKMAEQANKMQLLPQELADQLRALQQQFQNSALGPLQNLADRMSKGADPKQGAPDLKAMKEKADRLQKELEAMKAKLDAIAKAQKRMRGDMEKALADLRKELQRQDAGKTARDLEELRKFIQALRDELKRLGIKEEKLNESTEKVPDEMLPDIKKHQIDLEKELDRLLNQVKKLQKSGKMKRMKRRPDLPKEPYDPETGEDKIPPKEEDPEETDPKTGKKEKDKGEKPGDKAKTKKKEGNDEENEDLYMPALGGPRPKEDPRFKDKKRPVKRKPKPGEKGDPSSERDDLEARQNQKMDETSKAQQSLESDEQALARMLQQLKQALGKGAKGKDSQGGEGGDDELSQLMQSEAMQQALAMARRAQQGRGGKGQTQGQQPGSRPGGRGTTGNLGGGLVPKTSNGDDLAKLDPATRAVILKMPPRLREELLQGMREEGPEGYRKFIEDYFRRLTEVKGPK